MFNFKELQLNKRVDSEKHDPFVGIRRSETQDGFEFRLPVGFDKFPEGNFELIKQLFFRMYRSFKKFERDNLSNLPLSKPEDKGKDNVQVRKAHHKAHQFKDKEGNDVILYSKISVIETMLEAYQDLALNVIERTMQRSERIDYSRIDRYLHKAIYLDDDIIYIDEIDSVRSTLQYRSANLIELFCFILSELQQELEEIVDERVNELSNKFREQYLTHEQSLFDEETFETTVIRLKEILDEIDKLTAYKDDDYWQLYEAVEAFLYGELDMKNTHEDGIFWGINNFWQVWEDMCHTYAFKTFDDILYADTNIVINDKPVANQSFRRHKIFCKEGFSNPFFIEFRGSRLWMRPDLVRFIRTGADFGKIVSVREEVIENTNKRLANIQIRLLDKTQVKVYERFITSLNKTMNKQRGDKVHGARIRIVKNNPFYQEFKYYPIELFNEQKEFIQNTLEKQSRCYYQIIDWKYFNCNLLMSNDEIVQKNAVKQLSYELALQSGFPSENSSQIKNQFVIPFFYHDNYHFKDENSIGELMEANKLSACLKDSGIEVFKANFSEIQKVYLSL